MKITIQAILVSLLLFCDIYGQNEVERGQNSLLGIQEFGFTVNVEGSHRIAEDTVVTPANIRDQAIRQISAADLRFVPDKDVQSSADIPFLHMHINMLELDNGLIPFSVELKLYQPVRLVLNRDRQTSASTWSTSMVGIVSFDKIHTVNQVAENVVTLFIEEYQTVNRGRL